MKRVRLALRRSLSKTLRLRMQITSCIPTWPSIYFEVPVICQFSYLLFWIISCNMHLQRGDSVVPTFWMLGSFTVTWFQWCIPSRGWSVEIPCGKQFLYSQKGQYYIGGFIFLRRLVYVCSCLKLSPGREFKSSLGFNADCLASASWALDKAAFFVLRFLETLISSVRAS